MSSCCCPEKAIESNGDRCPQSGSVGSTVDRQTVKALLAEHTLSRLTPGEYRFVLILGGGAGGFGAAIKTNDLGARTALVNAGLPLGGSCVNVGCVPSKTLLWAAEVLHTSRHHAIPGLDLEVKRLDVAAIVRDELALVERLRRDKYAGILGDLEHVTVIEGTAQFTSAKTVDVDGQTLASERFVIATGSTATVPPIPGLRDVGFITHIEALRREHPPQSIVVVGAGPLGSRVRPDVLALRITSHDPAAAHVGLHSHRACACPTFRRDSRT